MPLLTEKQFEWIRDWRQKNGGHFEKPGGHALKVLEECVELCFAMGCEAKHVEATVEKEIAKALKKGEITGAFNSTSTAEELADISLCLGVVSLECGFFVPSYVDQKIRVLSQRLYKPDKDGVLRRERDFAEYKNQEKAWEQALANVDEPKDYDNFPIIVTLCGSTRFKDAYIKAQRDEEIGGKVVFSSGFFGHHEPGFDMSGAPGSLKELIDKLHLRKIEMSDEILVLDVDGYIGESTRREIEHATKLGKRIRYLSKEEGRRNAGF